MHAFKVLVVLAILAIPGPGWCQQYLGDPGKIVVEHQGQEVARLPAQRISLDYPELAAGGEVNADRDSRGAIWAVIAYDTGVGGEGIMGVERLFGSRDGGETWTSRPLPMTERRRTAAFTRPAR